MEFNVNATDAGALLRTGVGEHTLAVGDHNVTLMINGGRVALQRFALAVAIEAGLKVRVDGHIDGGEAYKALGADYRELVASAQQLANQLRRLEEASSTQDLAEKISAKIRQMGSAAFLGLEGLRVDFVSANADGSTTAEWRASAPNTKLGESRYRRVNAYGPTADAAVAALAAKLGVQA